MKNIIKFSQPIIIVAFFACVLWVFIPFYVDHDGYTPPFAIQAKTWPQVIAIIGFLMGILQFFLVLKESVDMTSFANMTLYGKRFVVALLIFLGFYLLLPFLGFVLANMLLLFAILVTLVPKKSIYYTVIVSIFVPILLYFIFNKLVKTQFPVGGLADYLPFLNFF